MLAAHEMMLPARLPKFKYEYHKSPTFKVYFHAPGYCLPAKRIWNETWRWIRIRPQRVCSHCQINSHAQMDTNEEPACCFSCYDYAASSSSAIYLEFCCKNLFDNVVSLVLGLAGQVEGIKLRPHTLYADLILILGIRITKLLYRWEKGGRDCGMLKRLSDSNTGIRKVSCSDQQSIMFGQSYSFLEHFTTQFF